jgi:N-acetylglucosamine-6-sulfatase
MKPKNTLFVIVSMLLSVASVEAETAAVAGSPLRQDASATHNAGQQRPNIIFILTDDQRYDAMGFVGNYPFLETPHIDRLANEGVHLKNSFCVISLCGPSRAAILTGTYPQINGVNTNAERREYNPDKTPPFPLYLQKSGYKTAFFGKWHMDHSTKPRVGFDHWVSFAGQGHYNGNNLNINGKTVRNNGYITDELTNYALDFIDDNADEPFFVYLSHKAVHGPFQPPERHQDLYTDADFPDAPGFHDDLEGKPEWQRARTSASKAFRLRYNNLRIAKETLPTRKLDPKLGINPKSKNYMRLISAVDDGIGEIYALLEEKGILDNTCIIFSSDNGYFLGEHLRGDKRASYNEGMRIPMVMRLPEQFPKNSTLDEMVLNIDIAPTILDMANAEIPSLMQGKSILPLFATPKKTDWRKSFLFTYWRDLVPNIPRIVAVRNQEYVYSVYPDIDQHELYDVLNDPYEMNNLADSPEYAPVVQQMKGELTTLKNEYGYIDVVPRPRAEPALDVQGGLIFDLAFNQQDGRNVQDSSPLEHQLTLTGGKFVEGHKGTALALDGQTKISVPWSHELNPGVGSFYIEALVKPDEGGVIIAQGNETRGFLLFVEDGKPGIATKNNNDRFVFVDEQKTSYSGEWVHIVGQIRNFENRLRLWVNGELIGDEFIMWPTGEFQPRDGGITIGCDPTGDIDPDEISPLAFKGEIEYVRIYRQEDASEILNRGKR